MSRIEDYALIGDCETAALVHRNGSIDWLCWPRFDSAACFAALLGTAEHGRWQITPADHDAKSTRRYRNHSLILETRFETRDGAVTVIDFMPPRGHNSDIVRLVRGERGRVRMTMNLVLRFDYGSVVPWVGRLDDDTWRAIAGPDMVVLRTPIHVKGKDMTTVAEFDLGEGDTIPFVLTYGASHLPPPKKIDPQAALRATVKFWSEWAARASPDGEWCDDVLHSLMVLKALTYAPTGGIVAAATTSLPECPGGTRNWDYRFCWLRDATLTLLALMNAGYQDEALAWRDWLLRAAAGSPDQIQTIYGIAGERLVPEWEVGVASGFEASRPVRVGNAAHEQVQLDVFGEMMDALHHARRGGIDTHASQWGFELAVMNHLEQIWRDPDESIWEVRGGAQQFVFSKVMAWVAFDRAIKTAEMFHLEGPVKHWRSIQRQIHDEVCEHGFDTQRNSFVQAYGSHQVDASLLLIPTTGFLPPSDPRIQGTIAAIERDLLCDGFVMRYNTGSTKDGLPPGEGAFIACSFWLADAYVLLGRVDDARALFERLLAIRNDVGLMAEEYDPRSRRQLGNLPQAFSHVALVNTAHNLAHTIKPAHQRSK